MRCNCHIVSICDSSLSSRHQLNMNDNDVIGAFSQLTAAGSDAELCNHYTEHQKCKFGKRCLYRHVWTPPASPVTVTPQIVVQTPCPMCKDTARPTIVCSYCEKRGCIRCVHQCFGCCMQRPERNVMVCAQKFTADNEQLTAWCERCTPSYSCSWCTHPMCMACGGSITRHAVCDVQYAHCMRLSPTPAQQTTLSYSQ